jgi:hypothetical protein
MACINSDVMRTLVLEWLWSGVSHGTYELRTRRRGRVREEARAAVEAHGGELWVERAEGDVRDRLQVAG